MTNVVKIDNVKVLNKEKGLYYCLSDIGKNYGYNAGVRGWLRSQKNMEFVVCWEKKNNPNFTPLLFSTSTSIYHWINQTKSIGLLFLTPSSPIYAHEEIALDFINWANPAIRIEMYEFYRTQYPDNVIFSIMDNSLIPQKLGKIQEEEEIQEDTQEEKNISPLIKNLQNPYVYPFTEVNMQGSELVEKVIFGDFTSEERELLENDEKFFSLYHHLMAMNRVYSEKNITKNQRLFILMSEAISFKNKIKISHPIYAEILLEKIDKIAG